jgi:CSLREA domain-containing protein
VISSKRSIRCLFILLILLVLFLEGVIHVSPVLANTITVTTTVDEDVNNAECSLREAIIAANTDAAYNGCSAGSGADIITVPAGTYTLIDSLTYSLPYIEGFITINGESASTTIIEANACNPVDETCAHNTLVFYILKSGTVTLNNMTLRHGQSDYGRGAIYNHGNLTINRCIIKANVGISGGAIGNDNTGVLTINNSIISNNIADQHGGGISNMGTLTVNNSSISHNSADNWGGGIYNWSWFDKHSILTINNSTINNNSAKYGGGIYNQSALTMNNSTLFENTAEQGGGLYNYKWLDSEGIVIGWSITTNCTFSSNIAQNWGGGIYNNGIAEIYNNTFSGNEGTEGAGICNKYWLYFTNSIIANSITGSDCFNHGDGVIGTNINNLVEDFSCSVAYGGDPFLGILNYNGGSTQTHALFPGSIAIDAGSMAECPATDQRGVTRPKGGGCDIGAFEFYPVVESFMPLIRR